MNYVRLGDVITTAKTDRCGENSLPILSITKNDGIILQSEKFKKRIASVDTANYKVVHRGQLVQGIHIDEANFGIQEVTDVGIVSPAYKIWNIRTDKIIPKFLEIVLRTPKSTAYYASRFNGSIKRRERISDKDFLSMEIPCPPMTEQQYAVDLINKVTTLVVQRMEQLTMLDELIKARFVEMFGDPKLNPNGYPECQLIEHIEFLTSGSRGWSQYCTDNGEEWFVTIKNVKNCHISVDNMQPVNAPDNAEARRTKIQEGDLLISITADLGRTGVVTKEIAEHGAYINQHLTCIRLNKDILNPWYVAFFMESPAGKEQFASKNQSAVKAGLNFHSINSLRLLVPPMDDQMSFVKFIEQADKSKVAVQKALYEAQLLLDSLMQKYFG